MRFNVVAQVSERAARSRRHVRRMMLGKLSAVVAMVTVGACATDHRVLRIPGDVAAGTSFHILADRGLGRPVVSQGVTASSTDLIIDWDLQTNSMWFPEVGQ